MREISCLAFLLNQYSQEHFVGVNEMIEKRTKIKREKNMKDEFDDIYEEEEEDFFSPTSWDKDPFETDEEYIERIQDQEDWLESFDD